MTGKRMAGAALAAFLAAACSDVTGPSPGASLNRFMSVLDDSVAVTSDSVPLHLAAGAHWQLSHGGAGWNVLVSSQGTGGTADTIARWRTDPTTLLPGTYVDTFTLQRSDAATVVFLDSLVIRTTPSPYIMARRAWLPGERDSAVKALGSIGVSGSVLSPDSVDVIVANPLYHPTASNFPNVIMDPTLSGMTMVGLDLFEVDSTVVPLDTTQLWLEYFWYNTTTPAWKGYTVVYSTNATIGPSAMNDVTWTANGGTSGGGGGEFNPTGPIFWQVTSGNMQVTSNTARTATGSTIASGPYAGGVQRNGTMAGRQKNVTLTEVTPTPGATQTWSLDFRTTPIPAARIECMWYGPPPTLSVNPTCNP